MKTRRTDEQLGHGLPPPPAPPSRDANPWPMTSGAGGKPHEPRHPRAPGWPPSPGARKPAPAQHKPRIPWLAVLVLFFVVGTGVRQAIRALEEGDVETAIGALLILAVAALLAVGRLLKRKSER